MSNRKQIILISVIVFFVISGLALLLAVGRRPTRITPRAEEAPQVTLSFNDRTPSNINKEVDLVVTVNDPALNDPETGAGVGIVTSTIMYVGDFANLNVTNTTASPTGWNIGLTKNDDGGTITLFASQNIFDPTSQPIKGTAVLGTITFTLTGEHTDFRYDTDAYVADSNGQELTVQRADKVVTLEPIQGATLKLDPATANYNPGDTFGVNIVLDTGGEDADGVTTLIDYDGSRLRALEINLPPNPAFPEYPKTEIDPSQQQIEIIALIHPPDQPDTDAPPVNGPSVLVATIHFQATEPGTAAVNYICTQPPGVTDPTICDPQATTGSLVSKYQAEGEGLLTKIVNGTYEIIPVGVTPTITISPPTPSPSPTPISTPTPTLTPTPTEPPTAGQLRLKLSLSACKDPADDLSRDVLIQINDNPTQTLSLNTQGVTDSFDIPEITPFSVFLMPEGYLPIRFNNVDPAEAIEGILDLTQPEYAFAGGNNNVSDQPAVDEEVNVLDFNLFKTDIRERSSENRSDFDCSASVNVLDYSSILLHWHEKGRAIDLL